MKISLITVTWNAEEFLQKCIDSVAAQNHPDLEYIIVDGGSTDNTLRIIEKNNSLISNFISEPDRGIYDAMNKGIGMATGDVIGILNADDELAYPSALSDVSALFRDQQADIIYGNLNYVERYNILKISRKWVSKPFTKGMFEKGWMPAHPTFYAKSELFRKYGVYDLTMGSAADYELMLRLMSASDIRAVYLDKVLVTMRTGGVSNASVLNRIRASRMDYRAMKKNNLRWPLIALIRKPLSKLLQFF